MTQWPLDNSNRRDNSCYYYRRYPEWRVCVYRVRLLILPVVPRVVRECGVCAYPKRVHVVLQDRQLHSLRGP